MYDRLAVILGKADDEANDLDAELFRLTSQAAQLEKFASKLGDDANNSKMKARCPSTPESSELSELASSEFEDF